MFEAAHEVLRAYKKFAVIGVSQDPVKFGHEVFEALLSNGYSIQPINPKYAEVDGHPCFPSLAALPERPEVVVVALGPSMTERIIPELLESGAEVIWLPPGCFTEAAVLACQAAGVRELHDICPVSALGSMCSNS